MYTLLLCVPGREVLWRICRLAASRRLCQVVVVIPLSDVEALVLDPLAAITVGVLEAKVVVVAELLGQSVI